MAKKNILLRIAIDMNEKLNYIQFVMEAKIEKSQSRLCDERS